MRLRFAATVPKHASEPLLNDDARDARPYRGLYAVSDGATESYNSRIWARTLAARFVARPSIDRAWLAEAIREYDCHFDRAAMSWSAQAAFDRGSFATLLGLQLSSSGSRARIVAIGDSIAILAERGRFSRSFPYTRPHEFEQRPTLLSTLADRNDALFPGGRLVAPIAEWDLGRSDRPAVLLMTDAIGAWTLADPDARMAELLSLPSRAAFAALVERERAVGRLKRDDSTLLIIE